MSPLADSAKQTLLNARAHVKLMYEIAQPFNSEEAEGLFCIEVARLLGLLLEVESDLEELGGYEEAAFTSDELVSGGNEPEETGDATEGGE